METEKEVRQRVYSNELLVRLDERLDNFIKLVEKQDNRLDGKANRADVQELRNDVSIGLQDIKGALISATNPLVDE